MSRGEECRLAPHVADVDFDDVRIKRDAADGASNDPEGLRSTPPVGPTRRRRGAIGASTDYYFA